MDTVPKEHFATAYAAFRSGGADRLSVDYLGALTSAGIAAFAFAGVWGAVGCMMIVRHARRRVRVQIDRATGVVDIISLQWRAAPRRHSYSLRIVARAAVVEVDELHWIGFLCTDGEAIRLVPISGSPTARRVVRYVERLNAALAASDPEQRGADDARH